MTVRSVNNTVYKDYFASHLKSKRFMGKTVTLLVSPLEWGCILTRPLPQSWLCRHTRVQSVYGSFGGEINIHTRGSSRGDISQMI